MFNHTQKTVSIFGKLFLSSGRFQHSLSTLGFALLRPLAPLLPTQLRCDWLPSWKRARGQFDQAYGGAAGVHLRR